MGYHLTESALDSRKRTCRFSFDTSTLLRPFDSAQGYVGQETHTPDSRLQGLGLRYYSASLARWISRDPIEERGYLITMRQGMLGTRTDNASEILHTYLQRFLTTIARTIYGSPAGFRSGSDRTGAYGREYDSRARTERRILFDKLERQRRLRVMREFSRFRLAEGQDCLAANMNTIGEDARTEYPFMYGFVGNDPVGMTDPLGLGELCHLNKESKFCSDPGDVCLMYYAGGGGGHDPLYAGFCFYIPPDPCGGGEHCECKPVRAR
jgi:RHS repeat-associated protein